MGRKWAGARQNRGAGGVERAIKAALSPQEIIKCSGMSSGGVRGGGKVSFN